MPLTDRPCELSTSKPPRNTAGYEVKVFSETSAADWAASVSRHLNLLALTWTAKVCRMIMALYIEETHDYVGIVYGHMGPPTYAESLPV